MEIIKYIIRLIKGRPSPANPNPKIEANPFKYMG
jgi:hypothetical protein